MKIKTLTLLNYRNYKEQTFTFNDGLNVLIGKNAQGKTNALEAIFYFAIGKSLRTNKDKDLICFDNFFAKISLELEKQFSKTRLDIYFSKNEKKTIKINRIPIKRIGELMGELNAVFFSPDELKLIKEAPEDRRRFLDIAISQTNKNYFFLLTKYEKILASRNRLLKDSKIKESAISTIDIWNRQLASTASKIILYRIEFLNHLSPLAEKAHNYLTDGTELLEIEYVGIISKNREELEKLILKKLEDNFEKDWKLGFTSVGPHRDDLKIKINGIDVRSFGSQGQQRTVALSLKLAELEIMKQQTGELPILLLDDVLSELDLTRKQKLLSLVKNQQTILTCTEFEFNEIKCTEFKIKNGKII